MEQNRIPSTDQSTWDAVYKVGDTVKIRIDFKDSDTQTAFKIKKIDTKFTKPYKEGSIGSGMMRKENPSGLLYELSNGQMWEGKDLELVESLTFEEPISKKSTLPSSFSEYDIDVDNIIILRVKEPKNDSQPPQDSPPQGSDEEQEVPKNVKDPFDDEEKQDGEDGDGEDGGKKGKNQKGKNQKGKGEDGDGEDGDGEDGKGEDGKGEDGDGEDGDDDFGGKNDDEIDFEKLMEKVMKDFAGGKSGSEIQAESDLKDVEFFLSTKADKIKEIFKEKRLAKAGIGGRQIFATDNEKRIDDVLNEIFK